LGWPTVGRSAWPGFPRASIRASRAGRCPGVSKSLMGAHLACNFAIESRAVLQTDDREAACNSAHNGDRRPANRDSGSNPIDDGSDWAGPDGLGAHRWRCPVNIDAVSQSAGQAPAHGAHTGETLQGQRRACSRWQPSHVRTGMGTVGRVPIHRRSGAGNDYAVCSLTSARAQLGTPSGPRTQRNQIAAPFSGGAHRRKAN
jgi:hypothetical protein